MLSKETAIEAADRMGFCRLKYGVFLFTSAAMTEGQKLWPEIPGVPSHDFGEFPYWLVGPGEFDFTGIHGPNDRRLLEVLK